MLPRHDFSRLTPKPLAAYWLGYYHRRLPRLTTDSLRLLRYADAPVAEGWLAVQRLRAAVVDLRYELPEVKREEIDKSVYVAYDRWRTFATYWDRGIHPGEDLIGGDPARSADGETQTEASRPDPDEVDSSVAAMFAALSPPLPVAVDALAVLAPSSLRGDPRLLAWCSFGEALGDYHVRLVDWPGDVPLPEFGPVQAAAQAIPAADRERTPPLKEMVALAGQLGQMGLRRYLLRCIETTGRSSTFRGSGPDAVVVLDCVCLLDAAIVKALNTLSAAGGAPGLDTAVSASPPSPRPHWQRLPSGGRLTFGAEVWTFPEKARNVLTLLDAFQDGEWEEFVPNPFTCRAPASRRGGDPSTHDEEPDEEKLKSTVKQASKKVKPHLQFTSCDSGKLARWGPFSAE
jgi:hypothetical protein